MATLYRHRVTLSNFPGGPGVATHYFLDQQTAMASLHSFWTRMASAMPTTVIVRVEPTGDILESTTGALTGTWSKPPLLDIPGLVPGQYSAPSGAAITWLTQGIVARRRVRGRTFIVPLGGGRYDGNGSLDDGTRGGFAQQAQDLVFEQSLSHVIWSRPFPGAPAVGTKPARAPRQGTAHLVTASRVEDKVAILRSRRD